MTAGTHDTRVFVGLELSLPVTENLVLVQEDLQPLIEQRGAEARWIRPQNLHLGIKHIGGVDRSLIPRIHSALRRVTSTWESFQIGATGVGLYPSGSAPRIVHAEITEHAEVLLRLVARVEDELEALGLARDSRPYRPSVLLGRIRTSGDPIDMDDVAEALASLPLGVSDVADLVLYESLLTPKGEHYKVLTRAPLGR